MTFENFPGMLSLPDRANPFLAKIKFGYFSKFCLHGVAYDLERLFKKFSDIFGQPEKRSSRQGHTHFPYLC